ncbi:T9SS type B sorting domain-containing protein [Aquimarina litoralis]|uniref:T9SS type B sorting domain-containing protein n=1 Tax=Aquimarina litoralis TaxID=584605 RepID=UPI001C58263E|nr:T9SS type B sorting domain-containing protein [Aquimarina litoralis]MBW1295945.1 T9SS type B sorting domain-containing protein [Aquimarina litoralis]
MKLSHCTLYVLLLFVFSTVSVKAQLGFCSGNSGDPIFNETFGTGTTVGPALPPGSTTYTFVNTAPNDGSYTISSFTGYFDWHNTNDRTPGDTNGKCFIVNADFTAGEFFRRPVTGLCENTSYEFSAWLLNLLPSSGCGGNGIPVNVNFQIWDVTDTTILASGNTGDIFSTTSPNWEQYGLVFQTLPGQTSVVLRMSNNGDGGCGNDLAIDDIVFRTCGDFIDVTDTQNNSNINECESDAPISVTLTANPDFSIYTTHAYQWQESLDNVNWTDIPGATNEMFTTPALTTTTYYRAKVAEDAINLANPLCIALSETYEVNVIAQPNAPASNGDVINCDNENQGVSVTVPDAINVNWYDSAVGGTVLQTNSTTYTTDIAGIYYAEAISESGGCTSLTRTAVQLDFFESPQVIDEERSLCIGQSIVLEAGIANVTYLWNTGETTPEITITTADTYTVTVTDNNMCSSVKTIVVTESEAPIIDTISSEGDTITITTTNSGAFEYSIDGINYQSSNVFTDLDGGLYEVFVREVNGCGIDSREHILLVYPQYFTPNNDGFHELWQIEGIEQFPTASVYIYDRYGKLLKQLLSNSTGWNGTYLGRQMPSSEYWFKVDLQDGSSVTGHFSLIR